MLKDSEKTIDDFKLMILSHWGNIRNEEKVMAGIEKAFKHLTGKELQELWIFIQDKSDMQNPSAKGIFKLAKDHSFRIRKSKVNQVRSVYVCGLCGYDNPMDAVYCQADGCGHKLTYWPKRCACGYEFTDKDNGLSVCPNIFNNGKKCGRARESGHVKRMVI